MYEKKETYGTDHSTIFSMQVNSTLYSKQYTYRYRWISYPVYSKYNSIVFQERCGVECDINGTVKIIVTVQHATVYYK
jgi:hypothetical protein